MKSTLLTIRHARTSARRSRVLPASALLLAAGIAARAESFEMPADTSLSLHAALDAAASVTTAAMAERESQRETLAMARVVEASASRLSLDPVALSDDDHGADDEPAHRLRSWELPAMTVVGEGQPTLREEELVGSYAQPRWTASRRFPTTRVYVIPEGKIEIEGWARGTFDDGESEWRFLQEVEIGLPHRFQLDLYLRQDYDTVDDDVQWGAQFEVRYALADWNKIWGNPTLYFEYIPLAERPDKIEPKLLLGGEITERWHWAANFVGEFELGGEREHEYQISTALSYTILDSRFSLGVEDIFTFADVAEDRGDFTTKFVIGPSIQWKPVAPLTINVAPLFGIGHDSPEAQLWINVGWEF